MAVKIRLARHGKKNYAFFHIVIADSRSPRDGKFIERIGSYNPNTNPASIELDSDKALAWIYKGAQPTDTCRRILSYKGVLLKKHLQDGVKKGALTQEQVDAKFATWVIEKDGKVSAKKISLLEGKKANKSAALEAEAKVKETRAEIISKKRAEEAMKVAEAEAARKVAEAPVEEVAVKEEVVVAEAVVETPATEEVVVAEAVVEAPATDEATIETKTTEA